MTTIAQDIANAHALVWDVRGRIGHLWPYPDEGHSLLFCLTELGESADAYLRNAGAYNRNNMRHYDINEELADVALMALTALGEDALLTDATIVYVTPFDGNWYARHMEMVACLSEAMLAWHARDERWRADVKTLLYHVATYIDGTLTDAVRGRLERIERRVMGEVG